MKFYKIVRNIDLLKKKINIFKNNEKLEGFYL